MNTAYRPLPVVTRRTKTRCCECVHEVYYLDVVAFGRKKVPGGFGKSAGAMTGLTHDNKMCGLAYGFGLFRDKDCPPGLPSRKQADAGLCDYFKPTLRTRLAWWLGLREREMLTLVDGEVVSGIVSEQDETLTVSIGGAAQHVAAVCEFGSGPPGAPAPSYRWD